jgi:hypothetical protein
MLQLGILSLGFHTLIYNAFAGKWIKSEWTIQNRCAPVSMGNTFLYLLWLCKTVDNTECYI